MTDREEKTLAIDVAGRFKPGKGEEGGNYKYLLVATFRAAKWNWKEPVEEVTDEEMQKGKGKGRRYRRCISSTRSNSRD
jgi:hypothetical protein